MTALAILGSATRTSLTSRGRSITTDLPMPSARKRVFAGATAATGVAVASAAITGASVGLSVNAAAAENDSARTRKLRIADVLPLYFISNVLSVTSVPS